jgi:hypothetical protein
VEKYGAGSVCRLSPKAVTPRIQPYLRAIIISGKP